MPGPIVACILSREEPILLYENVRHLIYHEKLDHIIVTNHVSIEANKAVLAQFGDKIVAQFDEPNALPFPQNQWRTRMCQLAAGTYGASWLVCTDTDEFWYNLHELHDIPKKYNSMELLKIYNHYGTQLDPTKGYSTYNMPWVWQWLSRVGKTIHRAINKDIRITHCSHRPINRGGVVKNFGHIRQHHYPVRDWERFLIKVNTANEKNTKGRRRTLWRKEQKAGRLRQFWETNFNPPAETLIAKQKEGTVRYFIPDPIITEE